MDISSVGDFILNIAIIVLSVLFFVALVGVSLFLLIKYKRYSQFECVIWGRDAFGQVTQTKDNAGIFVDGKTKNKRLFLKKARVGLDPDNVPYVPVGNKKIIYMMRVGLKNFKFIRPNIHEKEVRMDVGEEDVNWAINAYDRQKKLFNQNILLQYMPFIALAFTSIIILIMFIYFFKQFPTLLKMSENFKDAIIAGAQAQQGTVLLP